MIGAGKVPGKCRGEMQGAGGMGDLVEMTGGREGLLDSSLLVRMK